MDKIKNVLIFSKNITSLEKIKQSIMKTYPDMQVLRCGALTVLGEDPEESVLIVQTKILSEFEGRLMNYFDFGLGPQTLIALDLDCKMSQKDIFILVTLIAVTDIKITIMKTSDEKVKEKIASAVKKPVLSHQIIEDWDEILPQILPKTKAA